MKLEASGDFADKEGTLIFPIVSAPKLRVTFLFAASESSRVPTSTWKPAEKSGPERPTFRTAKCTPVPEISTCPKCGNVPQTPGMFVSREALFCLLGLPEEGLYGRKRGTGATP